MASKVEKWFALLGFPLAIVGLVWQGGTYIYERREVIEIRRSSKQDRDFSQRQLTAVRFYFDVVNLGEKPAHITAVEPGILFSLVDSSNIEIPAGGYRTVQTVPITLRDWESRGRLWFSQAGTPPIVTVSTTRGTYHEALDLEPLVYRTAGFAGVAMRPQPMHGPVEYSPDAARR
jgi:hypothetical protein